MDNLLNKVDKERNPQDKFWQRLREDYRLDIEKNKLYEGVLKTQKDDHGWSSSYYLLTSSIMYKYKLNKESITKSPKSCSNLTWKRVEPYSEESTRAHRYGFRLCRGLTFYDLYTEDTSDLENWLSALSSVAIMTELEDDFVLIRELGKGSYATVYLARSRDEDKEYAIKSISKEVILKSTRNTDGIVNEVAILRKLKHPRLVSLHKIYESPTHIHLILDYVSGGELFTRILKRGSYSEERAAKFIKNMLETLEYLHGLNIVHRDLKPENILMTTKDDDTEFKIADFGFASEGCGNMSLRCGSPGYVAPEILLKKGYGTKVDIFSVGIILLCGKSPFSGKSPQDVLHRNKQCNLVFHEKHWKKVSKEGIDMVLYLTREDPNERPSTTEALKHKWLYMNHTKKSPQSHNVSPNAQIPSVSPESGVSSVLMQRMTHRKNLSQDNAQILSVSPETGVSRVLMQRLTHRKNLSQDNAYFQNIVKRSEESKDQIPYINPTVVKVSPPSIEARKILVKLRESDTVVRHQRCRSNWMDPSNISILNYSSNALSEFTPLKPTPATYTINPDKGLRRGSGLRNSPNLK